MSVPTDPPPELELVVELDGVPVHTTRIPLPAACPPGPPRMVLSLAVGSGGVPRATAVHQSGRAVLTPPAERDDRPVLRRVAARLAPARVWAGAKSFLRSRAGRWAKRLVLLATVGWLASVAWDVWERYEAHRAGELHLAAIRAELDAADPAWRMEALTAEYAATTPPTGQNSAEIVDALARKSDGRFRGYALESSAASNYRYDADAGQSLTNTAAEWSPEERNLAARLADAPVGAMPMVTDYPRSVARYGPPTDADAVARHLQVLALSAAADGRPARAMNLARATLNAGRAVGDLPRVEAQLERLKAVRAAAGAAAQTCAWTEPTAGVRPLIAGFLEEADRDWLTPAFRGERAVFDHALDRLWPAGEEWQNPWADPPGRRLAAGESLVLMTRAVGTSARLPHHRWRALDEIRLAVETLAVKDPASAAWLGSDLPPYHTFAAEGDATRAELLTAAAGLACELYRQDHGDWPVGLADLVPAYLPAVPTDPYDGRRLRYKVLADGAVVYTTGYGPWDEGRSAVVRNPGGVFSIRANPAAEFRLWDPELRHIPPPPDP